MTAHALVTGRLRRSSRFASLTHAMRKSPAGATGLVIVLLVIVVAIFAQVIAPADPVDQHLALALKPPSWLGGPAGAVFGTDFLGRDIFSRVVYGSRVSLVIGVSAVLIAGTIGSVLGLVSGYRGGWASAVIMRLADFQLSVPFLILAIAVIGAVGPSFTNLIIVLGVTGWVPYARVIRSEVLGLREREFVLAARTIGASGARIMMRHLGPNVTASATVIASLEVARMITTEAALSFLGLGVQPPNPSWGGMVADGRNYVESAWWVSTFPGIAIVVTVLGINLLGDWLRDILDPYLRRSE